MKSFLLCLLIGASSLAVRAQRDCRQSDYQLQLLQSHSGLAAEYTRVENFTRRVLGKIRVGELGSGNTSSGDRSLITIPVVVHILYNTPQQNISDAQVQSQIDVLNEDYRGLNADRAKIPDYYAALATDAGIQFRLARVDPAGEPTTGILHKSTSIQYFGLDDRAKFSNIGGDDAWDASQYLNIWVCNTAGGILGYSSIPGGPLANDGVVIGTAFFGRINTVAPFNRGRTAVHEIGHWLNLRHLWGDAYCGDDGVADTPPQRGANRGCPGGDAATCGNGPHGDLYMDYMDFTDDACMFMFTQGQSDRMRALFAPGGPRSSLLASNALNGEGLPVGAGLPPVNSLPAAPRLLLFPNPVLTQLKVQVDAAMGNCAGKMLTVFNQVGQKVFSTIMVSNQQTLGVSQLATGIYFVRVEGLAGNKLLKFVKQ